jgi:hypothetical protein
MHRSGVKWVCLLVLNIAACAPAAQSPVAAAAEPDDCILPAAGDTADTLIIAVDDSIRPRRAPVPGNDAERLAFRQAYETLIRIDCNGRLRPGLASTWSSDSTHTVWRLELREVRLDDGTTLTAADVIASWARHGLADRRPWLSEVTSASDRSLVVTFTTPEPAGPVALADPALAIGVPRRDDPWPAATGLFRFEAEGGALRRDGAAPRALRFQPVGGRDLRDVLAVGVHLAITSAPDVITYAKGLPQYDVVPLPWSRTYLLVSPTAPPLDTGPDSASRSRFRAALARDAVTVDARAAEPPFAWETALACRTDFPGATRPSRRVVYPEADPTARALAERMVALTPSGPGSLIVTALPADALQSSLAQGADAAYILPFPLLDPASCRTVPSLPAGTTIEPLVDTREHLVLRRGAARLTVDGDGVPRLIP